MGSYKRKTEQMGKIENNYQERRLKFKHFNNHIKNKLFNILLKDLNMFIEQPLLNIRIQMIVYIMLKYEKAILKQTLIIKS